MYVVDVTNEQGMPSKALVSYEEAVRIGRERCAAGDTNAIAARNAALAMLLGIDLEEGEVE